MKKAIFPVILLFVSASAQALLADPKFDNFKSTVVGNKTTISYGSNGTVLAKTAPAFATAPNNAGVLIARKIPIAASNAVVEITATQLVSRKAIAGMFGIAVRSALIPSGLGLAALIALPYFVDYFNDSGLILNADNKDYPFIAKKVIDGSFCMDIPSSHTCEGFGFYKTLGVNKYIVDDNCFASEDCQYNDQSASHRILKVDLGPPRKSSSVQDRLLNIDGAIDFLSRNEQALSPEFLDALAKANGNILPDPTDPVILTGPPQSEPYNVVQSTKTGPDGTTTTEDQCVRHFVYDTSSVSLEDTCTSVTTAPNGTKTTADTKTPVTGTAPLKDGAQNDLASPRPSTLPASTPTASKLCDDFPSILACQTLDTPSGADIPKSSKTITYSQDNSFGAGSCPANKTMTVNGKQLTVIDWVSYCGYIADYLRPILILLASYAALIMLVPDKT